MMLWMPTKEERAVLLFLGLMAIWIVTLMLPCNSQWVVACTLKQQDKEKRQVQGRS